MKQFFIMLFALAISANITQAQTVVGAKSINITNFKAYAKDAKVIMEWATDATVETYNWEIQRSSNGVEFSTIAWVLGPMPGKEGDVYQYKDSVKGLNSNISYRLKHTAKNGDETYSEIIITNTK